MLYDRLLSYLLYLVVFLYCFVALLFLACCFYYFVALLYFIVFLSCHFHFIVLLLCRCFVLFLLFFILLFLPPFPSGFPFQGQSGVDGG